MRKEIIRDLSIAGQTHDDPEWLDVEPIARIQVTSEDPAFPIENALIRNPERNELGWRATSPGSQTVTLHFDVPRNIRRAFVYFIEREVERAQEFVLRYASTKEADREIVRRQWTFSPTGSAQEIEDYAVNLESVTKVEIVIDPDRGRRNSLATLNGYDWRRG